MKKNNATSNWMVITGVILLSIFTFVLTLNLIPNMDSRSFYMQMQNENSAYIESLKVENSKLHIKTGGNISEYCVKSTRSDPSLNNICWKEIKNNQALISIYKYKKYYIWIKDNNGNISNSMSINT